MSAPLFDEVRRLSLEIINASANENDELAMEAYNHLKNLCESNEGSDADHPLQWEALGDFSENHPASLNAYKKGLLCSEKLGLFEYTASIKFAIAESYYEQKNFTEAYKFASEASIAIDHTDDNELKVAIRDFLSDLR